MHETAGGRRRFAEEVRSDRPDLSTVCLLIGAEADPGLDDAGLDAAQIELDRLAGQLPYAPGDGARGWALALAELLGTRHGFRGSPGDYRRLESSLLHRVLFDRRGLPILLSVVWLEVARRAGAPVYGVALPGHFVVGFDDPGAPGAPVGLGAVGKPGGPVLADPFSGGRLLTGPDTETLVRVATGSTLGRSMVAPAEPLDITLRILNNIRAWAAARPERTDVQLWAVELALLLPSHPARLRYERAQLLVRRGDFLSGAAALDSYAEVVEAVDPAAAESVRREAVAARALLN
ncbi:transglutaminase-like domain-containing protein [Streptomyces sp. TP-A0874]|uniref:transglutaminase family protein n=1 Tax=Streptomyces sp. TP-A0874 TaxID=549819 RepID=UPI00085389D0|nr:transglutaminase-like domain-containing protein [Streptomyces sp. TP-A0874]